MLTNAVRHANLTSRLSPIFVTLTFKGELKIGVGKKVETEQLLACSQNFLKRVSCNVSIKNNCRDEHLQ